MSRLTQHPWLFALILMAVAVGLRAPWLDVPLWNIDEGVTITIAEQITEGDVLYRDAVDHRTPLVIYLKALVLAVAGDWNTTAVHAAVAAMLGWMAFLLWRIGVQLRDEVAGTCAAVAATITAYLLIGPVDMMAANTGWFVIFFSALGFWAFARSVNQPNAVRGLEIGLWFGAAALCKQPGLLDFGVTWVLTLMLAWRAAEQRRDWLKQWLASLGAVAALFAAFGAYYALQGVWDDFIYYAFTYNTEVYVPIIPAAERWLAMAEPFRLAWANLPVLTVLAVLAAPMLLVNAVSSLFWKDRSVDVLAWMILGWTATGIISTGLSGRTFAHYSTQVVPGFSLAAGWLAARIIVHLHSRTAKWKQVGVGAAAVVLAITVGFKTAATMRALSGMTDHLAASGEIIAAHTKPEDRIFVWGYYPEYYVAAQRLPATRFVYTNFLTGLVPWENLDALVDTTPWVTPNAHDALREDWKENPPEFIVDRRMDRGQSKCPLSGDIFLRSHVFYNYVQVAYEHDPWQARFFRKVHIVQSPPREELQVDDSIVLTGIENWARNEVPMIQVEAGAGWSQIELVGTKTRVLPLPVDQPVQARFFVSPMSAASYPAVVLRRPDGSAARARRFDYHPLMERYFRNAQPAPLVNYAGGQAGPRFLESMVPEAPLHLPVPGSVQLHAPARVIYDYDLPLTIDHIRFQHGIMPSVVDLSDGYDLVVIWEDSRNGEIPLTTIRVRNREEGRYRTIQTEEIALPRRNPGRLIFEFLGGPAADTANDHLYLGPIEASGFGSNFVFEGRPYGQILLEHEEPLKQLDDDKWVTHPPATITWPSPRDLAVFEFDYGIQPDAHPPGGGETDGVVFRLHRVTDNGEETLLWESYLDPTHRPEHRGPQRAQVAVPRTDVAGSLVFSTSSGPNENDAWDWAWIGHKLTALPPGPPVRLDDGRVLGTIARRGFQEGWSIMERPGEWMAHAPREMVYPKPAGLREVTYRYYLPDRAVRHEDGTRRGDGVVSVLEFVDDAGEVTELHRRALDPFVRPEDSGWQETTVDVPAEATGTLRLRMEPGPAGSNNSDWAYWGELRGVTAPVSEP